MFQTSIIRWVLVSGAVVAVARGRSTLTPDAMDILPGSSCTPGSSSSPGTPSKPYCEYAGEIYQVGDWWEPDPCSFCFCHDQNGYVEYNCHYGGDCFNDLHCEYPSTPVIKPGQCCPSCSDVSTTTTTTQPSERQPRLCIYDGETYQPGESFQPDPCTHCDCPPDGSGLHVCAIEDCFGPPCVDAIKDPIKCCPVCPNGPNCKHGDTIIPAGETVTFENGKICGCAEELPWSLEAMCMETRSPSTAPLETTPLETTLPPPPPVTTNALSPKEAKSLEKEARRQAKQEERQAKEAEREARRAERKAKKS